MKRSLSISISEVISYLEEMINSDLADGVEVTLYEQMTWGESLCPKALRHVRTNMMQWV